MESVILALIYVGLAFLTAGMAKRKGYSFIMFLFVGFISFIIGLIIIAFLEDKNPQHQAKAKIVSSQPAYGKRCRNCGTYIFDNDRFCRKCGASQAEPDAGSRSPVSADISGQDERSHSVTGLPVSALGNIACPGCGATQRADRNTCYKCGARFTH